MPLEHKIVDIGICILKKDYDNQWPGTDTNIAKSNIIDLELRRVITTFIL